MVPKAQGARFFGAAHPTESWREPGVSGTDSEPSRGLKTNELEKVSLTEKREKASPPDIGQVMGGGETGRKKLKAPAEGNLVAAGVPPPMCGPSTLNVEKEF